VKRLFVGGGFSIRLCVGSPGRFIGGFMGCMGVGF